MKRNDNTKSTMLTVKQSPERLEDFRIAAMLRGTTMSALVSQFIAQVVREEMRAVPEAFKRRNRNDADGLGSLIENNSESHPAN
jgi:hypothetical protein